MEQKLLFSKKHLEEADWPYLFLSKIGYGEKEANKLRLDKFEISLALSVIDQLPKIIEQTRKNAELLKKELGEEKFVFVEDGRKEINVQTRVPIYFKKPLKKVEKIWFELQEAGWETGLFYTNDFRKTTKGKTKGLEFSKKISEHMVPVGVQGLKREQVIELAERIKEFSK